MATIIPIWNGSSTFVTGSTPFGFFDTDIMFQQHADRVANWCATRLGYPIENVELQPIQFYACFEEAVLEYSNQVNQFSIRDNLFTLTGAQAGGNLTAQPVRPSLGRLIELSAAYGTEAGSGGPVSYKSGSLSIVSGQQTYDISNLAYEDVLDVSRSIEIKKIYHTGPPAVVKYFDPMAGTGFSNQTMLDGFGWGGMSPAVQFTMMPIYADLLRMQAIEFNDMIRKSAFSFELVGDRLRIFPIPTYDYTLYVDYITKEERSDLIAYSGSLDASGSSTMVGDFSNAPYDLHKYKDINPAGRQWIFKYTLALAKEVLGLVRGKYASVPIPNAEVTLNGPELLSQAAEEKDALIVQLRENLEEVSRYTQMQKQTEIADNMQSQLTKIPLMIYVG